MPGYGPKINGFCFDTIRINVRKYLSAFGDITKAEVLNLMSGSIGEGYPELVRFINNQ